MSDFYDFLILISCVCQILSKKNLKICSREC